MVHPQSYEEVPASAEPDAPYVQRKKRIDFSNKVVYHLHDVNDRLVAKIVDPEANGPADNSPVVPSPTRPPVSGPL